MAKTLVGLYDDRTTANKVLADLEALGFGTDHLQFASTEKGERNNYEVDGAKGADPAELTRMGVPEADSHAYAEGVRRGGALVIGRVHDTNVDQAADVMARYNPIPMDDRRKVYEKEGFSNYDANAAAYSDEEITTERARFAGEAQERMTEIEERIKVGKREVVRGGVRVHKYVDTDVVEETLRLREEHVDVNRTAGERPATAADLEDAFEEKTIEMVERGEEAIVEKSTVVTGEVAVGKEVDVREETVGGEVRSTRIEVEQLEGDVFKANEAAFRSHYDTTYKASGANFDAYRPAYGYGYAAGTKHSDRDYNDVESDLRAGYERTEDAAENGWENVKDAVQHAYNSAKDAVT